MKKQKLHPIISDAGYKSEAAFYKDFPTAEHYQRAHPDKMPPMTPGHMREGGVILMPGYNPPYANPYTKDIYTPGAGPNTMPSMHKGHMQNGGVLPWSIPASTPAQIPVKINQHATQMVDPAAPYMQPPMAYGGYAPRPGYHFDGTGMVKSKGGGTYADGVYFQNGGPYTTLLAPDANNSYGEYAYKQVPQYSDVDYEDIDEYKYGGQHVAIDYTGHLGDVAHYQDGGPVPEMKKGGIHIKPENFMQMGGRRTDSDNTRYSGNRYYPQPSILPPGSSVVDTTHRKVTDINPGLREYQHDFGQRVTYPGDTLTNNQLQSYVNRRDQIFNPYFTDYAHQTGNKPGQNFYYQIADKDLEKMKHMKRTDNFLYGPSSEEGYLPPPKEFGGRPFYKNGGVVEGEHDIDTPLSTEEIRYLKAKGYDVHY